MKLTFRCDRTMSGFLLLLVSWGLAEILTGCGAARMGQNDPHPAITVRSLVIAPQGAAVPLGNHQQFTATAIFSDGSKTDVTNIAAWSCTQSQIASVGATGIAISKATGTASISAVYRTVSGSSTLTVNAAAVVSLAVTPQSAAVPLGNNQQFTATATLTDGSKTDVTRMATWTSTQPQIASVDATGNATSKAVGATPISAVYQSVSGSSTLTVNTAALVSLTVTPQGAAVPLGNSQQFAATAMFTDGSKSDVTRMATWMAAQPQIASVDGTGIANSKAVGTTSISAVYQSVSGASMLKVNAATLVSLAVIPQSPSLTPNHSVQLSATGTFTDGSAKDLSSTAMWSSTPPGVVMVSSGGLALAQALGTATITATSNNISGSDTLVVAAPILQSISIATGTLSIPLGKTEELSAIGKYNDGSTRDLTNSVQWASSDPTILSLNASGQATADALGSVTVTAVSGTLNAVAQVQVGPPVVVSVSLAPSTMVIALGGQERLRALAKLSDGTIQDQTANVTWSSTDSSIVSVSDLGVVLAQHTGETTISASSDSVDGSADVTVKPVLAVAYFSNANTSGFADATVRLTNPGVTGGNLCAEVYVFDQDQQLSECCGCLVSPDGLLTLSVNSDLTGNPLTGVKSTAGMVKVVSADVSASCDPTAITPDAKLIAWSSNIQAKGSSAFAMTETSFQLAPLGDGELAALQSQCSFAATLGTGQGICQCGGTANDSPKTEKLRVP
jgi:hypothetical protein